MRILIVEDEAMLRQQLVERLRSEDFAVDEAADGETGLFIAREYPIDLAVIDIGLPKLSGIKLIRMLREAGRDVPVLILTARARWQEKVEGLEAGADDYLVKPFNIEELMARVRALLRRAAGAATSVVEYGRLTLDTRTHEVAVDGRRVDLTAYEFRILRYLILNAGKVVSKTELTEHVYDEDSDRDSNVIEVFIGRLRRKLDPEGTGGLIETLRGRGYRLSKSSG